MTFFNSNTYESEEIESTGQKNGSRMQLTQKTAQLTTNTRNMERQFQKESGQITMLMPKNSSKSSKENTVVRLHGS